MHYYQFNIADYRKDTAHLKPIEHYIYRTLIDWCYLDESPIPKETQTVLRRLGLGTEDEPNVKNVLSDFFYLTDSGWVHKRIEQEIIEYHTKCETNSTNGKKGGRPKKTQSVNFANPIESEKKPNQEPLTNNHKPEDITHTVYPSQQSREPTPAASVCLEIKKIGIIDINPAHPKLLMLIEAGATIDEFMHAARTAKDKGKGFAYVLGIVKSQRAEALQTKGKVLQGKIPEQKKFNKFSASDYIHGGDGYGNKREQCDDGGRIIEGDLVNDISKI